MVVTGRGLCLWGSFNGYITPMRSGALTSVGGSGLQNIRVCVGDIWRGRPLLQRADGGNWDGKNTYHLETLFL